jgi:hypothetical protein
MENYVDILKMLISASPLYTSALVVLFFGAGLLVNDFLPERKNKKKIRPHKYPPVGLSLVRINDNLENIVKILRLRKPGMVFLTFYKGNDNMLKFVLTLPTKSAVDVVKREVTVVVDGADPVVVELEGDALETGEFSGADGASVTGALVDVDDAGNRSPAREFTFALADTFAPPQPGEVGVRVTGEE